MSVPDDASNKWQYCTNGPIYSQFGFLINKFETVEDTATL